MPTQAAPSIWKGSQGPTPAVTSAEAKSVVHPKANPNPAPKTRPASTSRKNTSSTPPVPADRPRRTELIAVSTPSIASTLASMPPSATSASTTQTTTGRSARKTKGGSTLDVPGGTRTSSGQTNIIRPATEATASTATDRGRSGTATADRLTVRLRAPSRHRRARHRPGRR
jgi:hypothetical protein